MPHLGPLEIGLILVLVMIVFGVGKLPQVGGALGKGIREFRNGKAGTIDTIIGLEDETPTDYDKHIPINKS